MGRYEDLKSALKGLDLNRKHPGRIEAVFMLIKRMDEYPDLRIGQIVANCSDSVGNPVHYMHDEDMAEDLTLKAIFRETREQRDEKGV